MNDITTDPYLLQKIRRLTQALMISGLFNVGVLVLLSYWIVRENPPTTYCELKPATQEQQAAPLADNRGASEVIQHLRKLSLPQLIARLNQNILIENGYTERDLALSCLITFHHFDLKRSLLGHPEPQQHRTLLWKNEANGKSIPLVVYLGLTDRQFEAILSFAKTEKWPLTSKGIFLLLQKQMKAYSIRSSLVEAFMLTPEFVTTDLLFSRMERSPDKKELLSIVLEGPWDLLHHFSTQQKQLNDLSEARCHQFLIDYINHGSKGAALQLLKMNGEVARKLDDTQVLKMLQLLPLKTAESEKFATDLIASPRSVQVWQQASVRLYQYAAEPLPKKWDYHEVLSRFVPEKKEELLAKKEIESPIAPMITQPLIKLDVKPEAAKVSKLVIESKPSVASSKVEVKTVKVPEKLSNSIVSRVKEKQEALNIKNKPVSSHSKISQPTLVKKNSSDSSPIKQFQYQIYVVQDGDSLWKISKRFNVEVEILKQLNRLQTDMLQPGILLRIPRPLT